MVTTKSPPSDLIEYGTSHPYHTEMMGSDEAILWRALKIVLCDTILLSAIFFVIYGCRYFVFDLLKIGNEAAVQVIVFFSNVLLVILYVFIVGLHLYRLFKYGTIGLKEA